MSDLIERLRDADTHSQQRVLGSRIFGEAADRIEALEKENAELREATRKMHRRAQAAERTHMMVVDYLTNWYNLLGIHRHSKRDRLLFRWAIRELKSRSDRMSLMDAKEREE